MRCSRIRFDYKVAELTWENGQLAIQGLGPPRPSSSPKHTWEKPRAGGTLESIVDHATCLPPHKGDDGLLPPWFKLNRHPSATANDALVPCSKPTHSVDDDDDTRVPDPHPTLGAFRTCDRREGSAARKRRRVAVGDEGSASRHVRKETCETDLEASFGSHEPTSLGKTLSSRTRTTTRDDRDSICHSTPQAIVSTFYPFLLLRLASLEFLFAFYDILILLLLLFFCFFGLVLCCRRERKRVRTEISGRWTGFAIQLTEAGQRPFITNPNV